MNGKERRKSRPALIGMCAEPSKLAHQAAGACMNTPVILFTRGDQKKTEASNAMIVGVKCRADFWCPSHADRPFLSAFFYEQKAVRYLSFYQKETRDERDRGIDRGRIGLPQLTCDPCWGTPLTCLPSFQGQQCSILSSFCSKS
jgi:hypothetical protein